MRRGYKVPGVPAKAPAQIAGANHGCKSRVQITGANHSCKSRVQITGTIYNHEAVPELMNGKAMNSGSTVASKDRIVK